MATYATLKFVYDIDSWCIFSIENSTYRARHHHQHHDHAVGTHLS